MMSERVADAVTPPAQTSPAGVTLHYNPYPPPLAKYEEVVADPKLFLRTLEQLHSAMATKFMIPIIGGRDLDLHRLFVEVTTRGGIDKILREKKWKEVTAIFNFPSTATNASFVLRKYYFSLLHHYEQIYYFKAQGWTPMPHASLQSGHAVPITVHGGMRTLPSVSPTPTIQPQPISLADSSPQGLPSSVGTQVLGVIDGKFESGYLVTVKIGSEQLKGVLYQTAPTPKPINQDPQQQNTLFHPGPSNTFAAASAMPVLRRRRRKKSEIKRRDPDHPKPNRSGYNFFFSEQHARLKPLYHGRDKEISRIIGELWNNLNENERAVYQEKASNDKERYQREMEGYRERLRTGQVISNAVPIQQMLPDVIMADDEGEDDEEDDDSLSGSDFEEDGSRGNDELDLNVDMSKESGPSALPSNLAASPLPIPTNNDAGVEGQASDAVAGN